MIEVLPYHPLLFLLLLVHSEGALVQRHPSRTTPLDHSVTMDQYGKFVMSWTPRDQDIEIQLEVATQGYVGLGFSPNGGMKGADIVMGWVGHDGRPHISDRFGTGDKTPMVDVKSQDVELLFGARNNTHTILRYRRPWVSCDGQHDVNIGSDTVRVIWAFDSELPSSPDQSPLPYHDHRGVRSLYLRQPLKDLPLTPDVQHWDIRAPRVSIPSDTDTLYWCKLYKAPQFRQKNHFIGYKPIIAAGMEAHVHHMILYECHAPNSAQYLEPWVGEMGAQCYAANMPVSWDACNMPILAWAVGSQGNTLPEHVGFPIGEEYNGATYYMLEIHYNNPNLIPGLVDSSGVRLFHTPILRQYDAGVLQVGHTVEPFHIIPPGRQWLSTGHCTAHCTKLSLPDEGIKVFSGVFHSHLLGRGITLQHVRYGTELPTLLEDHHYDFNYQQERVLTEERTVLPGDHLIITCLYDASNKRNTTFGGFKTSNEMCLSFLSYYPRQQLAECFSRPDLALVLDTLGIQNMENNHMVLNSFQMNSFDITTVDSNIESSSLQTMQNARKAGEKYGDIDLAYLLNTMKIDAPRALKGVSLYSFLNDPKTWQNDAMVQTLQRRVTKGQYEPYCIHKGRHMPSGMPKKDKYPPYTPYTAPAEQCFSYPSGEDASADGNRAGVSSSGVAILDTPGLENEERLQYGGNTAQDTVDHIGDTGGGQRQNSRPVSNGDRQSLYPNDDPDALNLPTDDRDLQHHSFESGSNEKFQDLQRDDNASGSISASVALILALFSASVLL